MRRLRGRKGRSEVYVVLSKGVNENMVTHADFPMMSKELQTLAGVRRRIEGQDGHMINLTTAQGGNKRADDAPSSSRPNENRADAYDRRISRRKDDTETDRKQIKADIDLGESRDRDRDRRIEYEESRDKRTVERRSSRHELELKSRDDYHGREEKRPRRHKTESTVNDNQDEKDGDRDWGREREKRSSYTRDSSPWHRDREDDDHCRDRRDDDQHKERSEDDHCRERKDDDQRRDKRDDDHRKGRRDDYQRSCR